MLPQQRHGTMAHESFIAILCFNIIKIETGSRAFSHKHKSALYFRLLFPLGCCCPGYFHFTREHRNSDFEHYRKKEQAKRPDLGTTTSCISGSHNNNIS
jgi:hypothetical protein